MINKIGKVNSIDFEGLLEYVKPLDRFDRVKQFHTPIFDFLKTDMVAEKHFMIFENFYVQKLSTAQQNCAIRKVKKFWTK